MRLPFTKMEGLGNDFVVFDATQQAVQLTPEQVRHIADRRFGVGCDQVLIVEPATTPEADFRYRIFNGDGAEVEHCGNGARCFARFVRERGLFDRPEVRVETLGGPLLLQTLDDGRVRVNMGVPVFDPQAVPFEADAQQSTYTLTLGQNEQVAVGVVGLGNPHAVMLVPDTASAPVARLGPLIENHARFPRRVNAGFMAVRSRERIDLRVYERGAGETLACGSGACAAVVVGRLWGHLEEHVVVTLSGGALEVCWSGDGHPVWMTGPARTVFHGEIELTPAAR